MKEEKDYHQTLIYNNKTQDWEESLPLGSFWVFEGRTIFIPQTPASAWKE